jgi:group I intron endonuclease
MSKAKTVVGIVTFLSKSGIYKIQNLDTGLFYIGSAKNLKRRFDHHIGRLRNNKHKNQHLQNAWNKYGESSFSFVPILICEPVELLRYEQELINKLNPWYNICKTVKSKLGWVTPDAVKEKIRSAQIGKKRRPHTPEEKLKISTGILSSRRVWGHLTPETKEKIRVANVGKKLSDETRYKISLSNRGRKHTEETRVKLSISNKNSNAKQYIGLVSPTGLVYRNIFNMSEFCREHFLNRGNIGNVINGNIKHSKGWSLCQK